MKLTNTKIIIIKTFFGKWPIWFPAFLLSCARNDEIEWLFFTDCKIPDVVYPNIHFERMNLSEFNELASRQIGFHVQKGRYSQVDLQPAYGVIFKEYINGFDFWGHCDFDVIWGDIRGFITEEILNNFDIVSARKDFTAGHFTLWRNESKTNEFFRAVPAYREILSSCQHYNFDEAIISTYLRMQIAEGNSQIRVYWPEQMVVWFHGETKPIGWHWDHGKLFDVKGRERIYMHFQHAKKSVASIDFKIGDQPTSFKFTKEGIRSNTAFVRDSLGEKLKLVNLRQITNRFMVVFIRSLRLFKKVLLVRDIYWAQNLVTNSISANDVQYDPRTENLFLKFLDLNLNKHQSFFLQSYYWALQLVRQKNAKFYSNDQGELFVDVTGLRASIQNADDILALKEVLVDGIYNMIFSRPTVVLNIGMNVGLISIYFANQADVVVVGYEPCEKPYRRALFNISLNPTLSDRIRTFKAGLSNLKFKTIAMYPPKILNPIGLFASSIDNEMGPKFEYEEVEIEDSAGILAAIATYYPERDIVLTMDFSSSEYFIDGVSENHIINKLYETGKLNLISAIMMKWQGSKSENDPSIIARQLSDYGFKVFWLAPKFPNEGMLYAVLVTS